MLNGLDLFSGIGGLTLALSKWVQPVAYCEINQYCQGVLLSRMAAGKIPIAPIWDDITTLRSENCATEIDILYGGFPCQDISIAGNGTGLEGKRSGLFFELARLAGQIRPRFIFLENVPAITHRGGWEVVGTLTGLGYDCRWQMLSAAEVGAPHIRNRWWLLAYSNGQRRRVEQVAGCECSDSPKFGNDGKEKPMAHTNRPRLEKRQQQYNPQRQTTIRGGWRATQSPVCGRDDVIPHRVDRIKGLGNAVVPKCAEEAFKRLMGLTDTKPEGE